MAKKRSRPVTNTTGASIRVRMYRVGFGDCFLVTLPGGEHIVVDCGVHARGDIHTIERAVQNIVAETNGQVALLIATHAHQDHISGFASFEESFRNLNITEVWLPWTEDPKDSQATRLRRKQLTLVGQLSEHLQLTPGDHAPALAALMNIAGNERALENLHQGFGSGSVRYVERGNAFDNVGNVKGLHAQILGPPRDTEFLARMDPPAGQRYLRLGPKGVETAGVRPFSARWQRKHSGLLSAKDRRALDRIAQAPAEDLAFALDSALNNTSVVALFSYAGHHLLFPGDAQYGNWQAWLQDEGAGDILGSVEFYKVAHHGSFNATPKSALEQMHTDHVAAMVSTQNTPWPSIPLPKLIKALERQTGGKLVRSDSLPVKGALKGPSMAKLPTSFVKGDIWYEYQLPV
jgi:beta-lactamase superfamily II metal-dependent hydrolase